ncbi:MAG: DUF4954 family protein [Phycisphaerae bacterium]
MSELQVRPIGSMGRGFVPPEYLPEGKDEFYLRNEQSHREPDSWRTLRADEIETLVKNGNTADNWESILVTDPFTPHLIKNCDFYGLVRLGRLQEVFLEHHDLTVPSGLTNSLIISCDIGDDCAVHNVRYLSRYIVGDHVVLLNIDEMHTTNHAKFGNGIVKDGEDEEVRVWLDLINEAGGRSVMPFDGMLPADAYLWSRFPHDRKLVTRLGEITQRTFDSRRGYYGMVGDECVIKNSRIIKDVKVGPNAYIKGANKLKNLTVNSSADEHSQIGEGVELVNGIIGYGCRIFYGCKGVRFVMGDNSNLKYGARLIHSLLGDNSTISCCEVLNDLIFPSHEQHHNNSFLIASLVQGQSNIAACATIGSNHNSRAPDGEIHAGRGFWPGLCVSLKHNCRFASFALITKGDYHCELNVPLPFCLIGQSETGERLHLMPGYWWLHNMYALARNTWKIGTRDKRKRKLQHLEFDSFAPDTAEELFAGMKLLERWTAQAYLRNEGQDPSGKDDADLAKLGRELLTGDADRTDGLVVTAENVEKSDREVRILKPRQGYLAYGQMLHYYAVKNLLEYLEANDGTTLESMHTDLAGPRRRQWENLGGQIVARDDVDELRRRIGDGELQTWDDIHRAYDELWQRYPRDKQAHAYATLLELLGVEQPGREQFAAALDEAVVIQRYIRDATYESRKKDYDDPFRTMVYESPEEMEAVVGTIEDNSFVRTVREQTETFEQRVEAAKQRL